MELLTVKEVAKILRVDSTTCRRWIREGALEAITLPSPGKRKKYRVKRETIDRLMERTA